MWTYLLQSVWIQRIGWTLIHSLWQFAFVALLAIMMQRALRRRTALLRYGILLAAMSLVVIAPLVTGFSTWIAEPSPVAVNTGAEQVFPMTSPVHIRTNDSPVWQTPAALASRNEAKTAPTPPYAPPTVEAGTWWSATKSHVQPWLPEIVLVWFAGVFFAAFRPVWSWQTVRRLKMTGISPVSNAVQDTFQRIALRLKLSRTVQLLQSALVSTPVVLGYFRPVILLPVCVLAGLPPTQLESILAHELAHIRRHDYLVNVFQTLVETLFFYHPAVWWLSRQIRNERENCCDDVAMALVGNRAEYGRALLAIEELRAAATTLSLAARGGSLLARIRRIAGQDSTPSFAVGGSFLGAFVASLAIFAAATVGAPQSTQEPKPDSLSPTLKSPDRKSEKIASPISTSNTTEQAQDNNSVTVKVVDEHGKPLADATVGRVDDHKNSAFTRYKTDSNGSFQFPPCEPGNYSIVATAPRYAPESYPVRVDLKPQTVELKLEPAKPIRIRVVDKEGQAVPNADVTIGIDTVEGFLLHCALHADSEGRWMLLSKPGVKITVYAWAKGFARVSKDLASDEREQVFTLAQPLWHAQGRIIDAQTKEPVPKFRILQGRTKSSLEIDFNWKELKKFEDPEGKFSLDWEMYNAKYNVLRFEADGYLPSEDHRVNREERQVNFDVELTKGQPISGTVRMPDGKPLADAEVVLCTKTRNLDIRNGRDFDHESSLVCRSNTEGQFSFNPQREPFLLIVLHDKGYAQSENTGGEIVVRPWARIEGTIQMNGRPANKELVSLYDQNRVPHPGKPTAIEEVLDRIRFQHYLESDKAGRFTFNRVRPGNAKVYHYVREGDTRSPAEHVELQIAPGETKPVTIEVTDKALRQKDTETATDKGMPQERMANRPDDEPKPNVAPGSANIAGGEKPKPVTTDLRPAGSERIDQGMEKNLRWGEPVNALRGAIVIRAVPGKPKTADMLELYLVVQNVSDAPIHFSDATAATRLREVYIKLDGETQAALVDKEPAAADVVLQSREVVFLRMFSPDANNPDRRTTGSILAEEAMKDIHQTLVAEMQIEKAPAGVWTGKLVTGETSGAIAVGKPQPKGKEAQTLFQTWQEDARLNGKIPGGALGSIARVAANFVKFNPTDERAPKNAELLKRIDTSHDWTQQEAVALLDEITTIYPPLPEWAVDEFRFRNTPGGAVRIGQRLPTDLNNAPWGQPSRVGLRVAWLLEPRAEQHRLGTPLKSRILFHNMGKNTVVFPVLTWYQSSTHKACDAKGAEIKIDSTHWTTIPMIVACRLAPGEFIEVSAAGIGVGARGDPENWQNTRTGSWVEAKEGDEVTFTPASLVVTGKRNDPRSDAESGWWLNFIKERLSRGLPLPDDGGERKHLLDLAVRDLFGTAPMPEEIAAFVADREPNALDALAKRLAQRAGISQFAGTLQSGVTKFRILAADPDAAKKPRTANNPGRYTLREGVVLAVSRRPDGERLVNEASIQFSSPNSAKPAPGAPYRLNLPDGYDTWAAAWVRGETVLWLQEKNGIRRYDFSDPAKMKEEAKEANQVPAEILEALRAALPRTAPPASLKP